MSYLFYFLYITKIPTNEKAAIINIKLSIIATIPKTLPALIALFKDSDFFALILNIFEMIPNTIPIKFIMPNATIRICLANNGRINGSIKKLDPTLKVVTAIITETIPNPRLAFDKGRELGIFPVF